MFLSPQSFYMTSNCAQMYIVSDLTLFINCLLVQDSVDYQGRSYLHIPKDLDVKLDTDEPPERCYLPKKHIHTWLVLVECLFKNTSYLVIGCYCFTVFLSNKCACSLKGFLFLPQNTCSWRLWCRSTNLKQ